MFAIGKYQVIEQLFRSGYTVIYRAVTTEGQGQGQGQDSKTVILKLLNEEFPSPDSMARFRREYELTKMIESDSTIKAYDLFRYQNTLVMVLEDTDGISLAESYDSKALPIDQFLPLAINIAEALADLHRFDVIHKGITPSNLLLNPSTNKIKIIDFGLASEIPLELGHTLDLGGIEGSLAFISPEQTGRINRPVDHRTDYYSLGMTYYQLLTGTTPFQSADPMQWVHWHIAQSPRSPSSLDPSIPNTLSEIILKLLAKTAEARYASLPGLIHDLKRCWKQYRNIGEIEQFEVSTQDISSKLQISKKLYGRSTQLEQLVSTFDEIVKGEKALLSVVGPSGIGKSCFVKELSEPLLIKRGFFIGGKFDQFNNSTPYSCFMHAIKDLITQILGLDDDRIAKWKETILDAVGNNGKLITDVIPELELIIGRQSGAPASSAAETKNRFHVTFQRFVSAFCGTENPMVMYLDDLQWADLASLQLIEQLMQDSATNHLMIIVTYRNNEVNSLHPVSLLMKELAEQNREPVEIELAPLTKQDVEQLLADTFQCDVKRTAELANRCLSKTLGNPFFLTQFLEHLNKQWLIQFDHLSNTWCWDIDKIDIEKMTDNVVDLMVEKIRELSPTAYQLACSAACIGNQFDLNTLSSITMQSPENTANGLWELLKAGLLIPIDQSFDWAEHLASSEGEISKKRQLNDSPTYRFLHDRVQQAAYSLLPDEDKQRIHLSVGQALLDRYGDENVDEVVFDIANHLNLAASFSSAGGNLAQLAEINLRAGKKAKASAAFESAFQYLNQGIEYTERTDWLSDYDLMLALYTETTELACINADFDRMEVLADIIESHAKALIDRVPVYETRIRAYISKNDSSGAVREAYGVLKLLGVEITLDPQMGDVERALIAVGECLASRKPMSLMDLPEMTDLHLLAAMRILNQILSAAYQSSPLLFPIIVSTMIQLSVKHGNCSGSTFAYSSYGLVLCGLVGDIETGYQFGKLSIKLLDKLDTDEFKAKTLYAAYVFVDHWKRHIKESLAPLKNIFQVGLTNGDFEYAGWAGMMINVHSFFAGKPLEKLNKNTLMYLEKIQQMNQKTAYLHTCIFAQTLTNLTKPLDSAMLSKSESEEPAFYGELYSEEDSRVLHEIGADRTALSIEHFNRLLLSYFFGNNVDALKQSEQAEAYLDGLVSSPYIPVFYFFDSLTRLASCRDMHAGDSERDKQLEKVSANQEKLKFWAERCPENCASKYKLVEAETIAVTDAASLSTIETYQASIKLAIESGFLHEEALANERLAEYLITNNQADIAKVYLTRAYHIYQQWGATAKLGQLLQKHPLLLSEFFERHNSTSGSEESPRFISEKSGQLDFSSIMKATQAISGEIVLQNLLETMMRLVLENAGGQKGHLLLAHESSDGKVSWSTEVTAHSSGAIETHSATLNFAEETLFPSNIVQTVIRTNAPLVITNASAEAQFCHSAYIERHQTKSVLCAPVIYRGKLSGIIYLENDSTIGAFTENHLNTIQLMSTQMAISLENAKLYASLEERVVARTQDLEEANEKLTLLATTDSLTNSLNRRYFWESANKEVERAKRFQRPATVIMMDIDNFKQVNDTYGHAAGDQALRHVASICKNNLRGQDLFGRIGGEEFALLSPENGLQEGIQLAERIRQSVESKVIETSNGNIQVTVSIGLTAVTQNSSSIDQLLQLADEALYQSKQNGKNQVNTNTAE